MDSDERKRLEARIRELEWEVKVYKKKDAYWYRLATQREAQLAEMYRKIKELAALSDSVWLPQEVSHGTD